MNEERLAILGARLKMIRGEANMKQKEFAELLGIATTTYSGYESGKHEPNIDFLIKIADMYNLSLDYVVGRSVNKGGIADDEVNQFLNDNLVEPLKQEGKTKVEIMEDIYQKFTNQMSFAQQQMLEMRRMIDEEKAKENIES